MTILVKPPELRSKAGDIRQHASRIQVCIDAVDSEVTALNSSVFEGVSAETFRTRYRNIRDRIYSFKPFLESFGKALEDAAAAFESADKAGN